MGLSAGTRYKPFFVLLFLSPITAEMLTGSTPPLSFFSPLSLLFLLGLYGCGANIMRELARRWGGGWTSIVLLGAAYGIIEEGLATKSFFDPNWPDLGYLAVYGRWLGVNWVWSEWLIIFHAVVSITVPILLVELLFPRESKERWLTGRTLAAALTVLSFVVMFMFSFISAFRPGAIQVVGCLVAVLIFGILAKRTAKQRNRASFSAVKPVRFFILSLFVVTFLFFFFNSGPYLIASPPLLMSAGGLAVLFFWQIYSSWGRLQLTDMQKFGTASGLILLWIALEPVIELGKSSKDETGLVLAGIAYAVFLVLLWSRLRKQFLG